MRIEIQVPSVGTSIFTSTSRSQHELRLVSGNITVTGLAAPCTVPVDIYRDGVKLTTLSVNVASSGVVPFAFTDENAVTSHTYRAEVVNATCGCTGSTAVSVWNSSDGPPTGGVAYAQARSLCSPSAMG